MTATNLNPARQLELIEIDASGVDLSDVHIPDIEILGLVIWTHETTWPALMEDVVRNYSQEIQDPAQVPAYHRPRVRVDVLGVLPPGDQLRRGRQGLGQPVPAAVTGMTTVITGGAGAKPG